MKRIISLILMLVIVVTTVSCLSTVVSAQSVKIEYDSKVFNFIPSDAVYVNGKQYKKYVVIDSYQGLTSNDVIYVDSDGNLVTDRQLLNKLVYTNIIKSRIVGRADTLVIVDEANKLNPKIGVIEDLGNDLIEKTIASSISCNFKGILAAMKGDVLNYASEYVDLIKSFAIEGTMYVSYLANLDALATLSIENSKQLLEFNNTVGNQINDSGLAYEDALLYESIVRDCIGAMRSTDEYTIYLAQCVSGDGVNDTADAWGVLGNMVVDFTGDAFGKGIACAFTDDIADIIKFCSSFDELFKVTYDSLGIADKLKYYGDNYQMIDSTAPYYIDINDVLQNVSVLTKEDITPDEPIVTPPSQGTTNIDLKAFNAKLSEFKASRYAHGSKYKDNPTLTGGYECFGFANELAKYIFGSYPTSSMSAKTVNAGWTRTYGGDAVDNLCVGDVVRYGYHSIFITGISGDTIYYCQANVPVGTNKVTYDNSISRSSLKTKVSNKLTSPNTNKTGWVAHFNSSKIESTYVLTRSDHANLKDGIYTFKSYKSGKYMAVEGSKNADGTNVLTYDYKNTDAFKFYVKHVEDGKYLIYSLASKSGSSYERVLDVWTGVYSGTPEPGDRIDIYKRTSTEDKCQLFYMVPMSNGTYVLELASVPGLVVASKNAENALTEGGAMTARTYKGYTTQQWYLCDGTGARVDASIDAPTGAPADYTAGVFKVTPTIGLNMRSGPGTEHSKVGSIPQNVKITITEVNGSWGWTSYNGIPGWVSMEYLEKVSDASSSQIQSVIVNPTFSGASITLQNNISVSFKVNESFFTTYGYKDPYVVFELGEKEVTVAEYTVIDGKYAFVFGNIEPNQMTDTITATLYVSYEDDIFATAVKQYSIAEYCYSMLDKYLPKEYANLRTLLVDLLNYGAASQLYTNYNCDRLANADLTSEQMLWATQEDPLLNTVTNTQYETVDSPKVIWNGAGLVLNDSITVRFKFSAESIEDLSARVKIGEREYVIPSDQFIKSEGKYYVYFDKLIVSQLKEDIFVTVYEGDEAVSNTVRYSVESYAYEKQNSDIANLATLVKTMMKYGNSAYNYSVQK